MKTPLILLILMLLATNVSAQSGRSQKTAAPRSNEAVNNVIDSDEPWLVTVIHQIDVDELQRSLAQRGIKFQLQVNGQNTEYRPINITTGIAIDRNGHVLTRLVNIDPEAEANKNGEITVKLANGEEYPARFIGIDGPTGFCVLAVAGLNVPPAQLADDLALEANENVTLVNVEFKSDPTAQRNALQSQSKQSLQSKSFTKSKPFSWLNIDLLSQTGKVVQFARRALFSIKLDSLLKTNSFLNLGAVLNSKKEVVGIPENGQAYSVQVFSALEARRAADRILARNGNVPRGWLGVDGRDYLEVKNNPKVGNTPMPKQRGVLVNAVVPNSPAEQSGLQQGDVILNVNGESVDSADTISSYVALQPAGEELRFTIWRNSKQENILVKLGERGYASTLFPDDAAIKYRKQLLVAQLQAIEKSLKATLQELEILKTKAAENENSLTNEDQQRVEQLRKTQEELEVRKTYIDRKLNPVRAVVKPGIEKNWLGIEVEDVYTPKPEDYDVNNIAKPRPQGVRIKSIERDSIAAKAGLQVGDVIVETQQILVGNRGKLTDALSVLYHYGLNTMDVNITRGTEKMTIRLNLGRRSGKK